MSSEYQEMKLIEIARLATVRKAINQRQATEFGGC